MFRMPTHSRSRLKLNAERRFPIRVRITTPEYGYGATYDAIHRWLLDEVGRGNFVWTSDNQPGHDASAVYLSDLDIAQRMVERFGLELLYLDEQKLV